MGESTLFTIAAALAGDERIGEDSAWRRLLAVVSAKVDVAAARGDEPLAGIERVARQLAEASAADEEFAARLAEVWELAARGGRGARNVVLGEVSHIIQADTITGVVTFGSAPRAHEPEPEVDPVLRVPTFEPATAPMPTPAAEPKRRGWFQRGR